MTTQKPTEQTTMFSTLGVTRTMPPTKLETTKKQAEDPGPLFHGKLPAAEPELIEGAGRYIPKGPLPPPAPWYIEGPYCDDLQDEETRAALLDGSREMLVGLVFACGRIDGLLKKAAGTVLSPAGERKAAALREERDSLGAVILGVLSEIRDVFGEDMARNSLSECAVGPEGKWLSSESRQETLLFMAQDQDTRGKLLCDPATISRVKDWLRAPMGERGPRPAGTGKGVL